MTLSRRRVLVGSALLGVLVGCGSLRTPADADTSGEAFEVTRTEAEWRQLLDPEQYEVLREAGTEAPFTSALNDEKRVGVFGCAGCDRDLFASETKFDSGTGWPSFWTALDGAVVERPDASGFLPRTEILCRRCGGHLGHVFDDGPQPTGLRYCMNGVALTFRAS